MSLTIRNRINNPNFPKWIEAIIIAAGFAWLWFWIADHAGGPLFNDEVLYMKAALFPDKYAFIINRYFHIYLMMPFFAAAGGALEGVRYFWGFLVSLTGVLVYVNSRLLSRSVIPGLIGVLLFFSQSLVFFYPGVVWTDYTVMFLSSLALLIYLLLPKYQLMRQGMLVLLGMLFYFLFRTKETGLPLAVLLTGLGFISGEVFDFKATLRYLFWIMGGIVVGVLIMMLLDQIVLGDAFFAWRFETIKENLKFNIVSQVDKNFAYNYYQIFADRLDIFTAGIFYFLSVPLYAKSQNNFTKIIWLFPLATIVFLVLTLLRGPGVIVDRYLIPILPYFCVLAAQLFNFEGHQSRKKFITGLFIFITILAIAYFSRIIVVKASLHYGIDKWDEISYFSAFVYPIVFSIWLGSLLFVRRYRSFTCLFPMIAILLMSYPPLHENWVRMNTRWAEENSSQRFYPLALYADQINYSPEMKMFVSNNLPKYDPSKPDYGMLDGDSANVATLFSLYFKQEASPSQFIRGNTDDYINDFEQVDYAFLTTEDWRFMPPEISTKIEKSSDVSIDPKGILVFIKQR